MKQFFYLQAPTQLYELSNANVEFKISTQKIQENHQCLPPFCMAFAMLKSVDNHIFWKVSIKVSDFNLIKNLMMSII